MLRLIIGRAGTGKTTAVMEELRQAVAEGRGGGILLVPEQYSHEAERELCRRCGDKLSLYAEVFSFTGLARRLSQDLGGGSTPMLDKGGRLLCMALALNAVGSRLRVYAKDRRRAELQSMLLRAVDELKSACVGPEQLSAAAEQCSGTLSDKLRDLALILSAYDAVVAQGRADPADRLTVLARQIGESRLGPENRVYVDGFTDFTLQEQAVLRALLQKGVELTVCLTADGLRGREEIFALSRSAAGRLLREAESLGIPTSVAERQPGPGRHPALRLFTEEMFRYSAAPWQGEPAPIRLIRGETPLAECEIAAGMALRLVRERGCRWRDIAVAVRGFADYRSALESSFSRYGVPLFVSERSDLLSKPLPALISLAYELIQGGFELDDMLSYLRTGLTGLSLEEADLLGGYLYTWQLRGSAWERPGDWRQHPGGYGAEFDEATRETLERINALRRRVAEPLLRLARRSREGHSALEQAQALSDYLRELRLPELLERRGALMEREGRLELSRENAQLWELLVRALEQFAAILGETEMDGEGFSRLFLLMLSQYDIGLIPVALDRVSAGDFDRMRRRNIRHLLVLGCSDTRLPPAGERGGVFSDEEKERLYALNIDLGSGEGELWREYALIYNCLSLPSESLSLIYPGLDAQGDPCRPAYVFERAKKLFSLGEESPEMDRLRLLAEKPALSLAARGLRGGGSLSAAAAAWFDQREPERLERLRRASRMSRGRLSREAVEALYGRRLRLSASKIDKFASCKFAYFCQYGLRAKPHQPAGFTAPEIGTFLHKLLENTAREVNLRGGFPEVSDQEIGRICDAFVTDYIHRELNDFQEKSPRFRYLFQRVCEDGRRIALDMAEELRRSDFSPLDFELDFGRAEELRPISLGQGDSALKLTGQVDRVDGWVHEGKLYLRVVDYKTGQKEFSLSDVWYGMGLQMLLYLFALGLDGEKRYGREIVPAGVIYFPARNLIVSGSRDMDEEELNKARWDKLRRSGLVLDEPALREAWEKGEDKRYIPVKARNSGRGSCNSLASAARMGMLARHIETTLGEMAGELHRGSIAADPWYRSQQENACLNCPYLDACFFSDGENGESCRTLPGLTDQQVWEKMEQAEAERSEEKQ